MDDKGIERTLKSSALTLKFAGDSQTHSIDLDEPEGVEWDEISGVLTLTYAESDAVEIFLELMEIIPALRKDRR